MPLFLPFVQSEVDFWICGFPLDVRIHLICLSNSLRSFDPFYVTAHCRQQCPSCTPCQERKAQQPQQIPFFAEL